MYVIRLSNGKYLGRNCGYTNNLEDAKIYIKQHNARSEARILTRTLTTSWGLTAEALKVRLVVD